MATNVTILVPAPELAPGAVGAIRNQVAKALLAKVSRELQMSSDQLVVRDIRPQADLDWGSGTAYGSAVSTELWEITTASNSGYQEIITSGSTTMADQRFVAIYGLRDARFNHYTVPAVTTTLFKFDVGHSIKCIWDITKLYSYRTQVIGISPSAIIIPQNTYFQISGYVIATTTVSDIQLEGLVVEPRGLVISP